MLKKRKWHQIFRTPKLQTPQQFLIDKWVVTVRDTDFRLQTHTYRTLIVTKEPDFAFGSTTETFKLFVDSDSDSVTAM